jgi:hypothetical protein
LSQVVNTPVLPPSGLNWLAKIRLDLATAQYYAFFGIAIDPALRALPTPPPAAVLAASAIPTLKSLDLIINDPYDTRYRDENPWS